jgi:hypothetical protein
MNQNNAIQIANVLELLYAKFSEPGLELKAQFTLACVTNSVNSGAVTPERGRKPAQLVVLNTRIQS